MRLCNNQINCNFEVKKWNGIYEKIIYKIDSYIKNPAITQRRVCLTFTEDYVRVYLHCFKAPQNKNKNDFSKALYTSNYNWRHKKNNYNADIKKIIMILMKKIGKYGQIIWKYGQMKTI